MFLQKFLAETSKQEEIYLFLTKEEKTSKTEKKLQEVKNK